MKEFVEAELARLDEEGRLTPNNVVDAARDPANPLHEEIEWRDEIAGPLYRQQQARTLIRTVKLEMTIRRIRISVPAYIHDPSLPYGEQGYTAVTRLRSDEERKRLALNAEIDRVKNAASRAREIGEALGMSADVHRELADAVLLVETELVPA